MAFNERVENAARQLAARDRALPARMQYIDLARAYDVDALAHFYGHEVVDEDTGETTLALTADAAARLVRDHLPFQLSVFCETSYFAFMHVLFYYRPIDENVRFDGLRAFLRAMPVLAGPARLLVDFDAMMSRKCPAIPCRRHMLPSVAELIRGMNDCEVFDIWTYSLLKDPLTPVSQIDIVPRSLERATRTCAFLACPRLRMHPQGARLYVGFPQDLDVDMVLRISRVFVECAAVRERFEACCMEIYGSTSAVLVITKGKTCVNYEDALRSQWMLLNNN